jgi:hypothetical protein
VLVDPSRPPTLVGLNKLVSERVICSHALHKSKSKVKEIEVEQDDDDDDGFGV